MLFIGAVTEYIALSFGLQASVKNGEIVNKYALDRYKNINVDRAKHE